MSNLFATHLQKGTHAARPAANASGLPIEAKYACSDHGLIYETDGTAWSTWFDPGPGTSPEVVRDTIGTALIAGSGISITVDDPGDTITVANTGAATRSINAQTGTSYTAVLADAGKFVTMSNAGASTLTVPPNSSVAFPVGTVIEGAQLGAGQVTLTPGAGVTINGTPGLKIAAQYGTFGLLKIATDTWLAMGRLSA